MKITKNSLRELKIYNSYNLARAGSSKLFINYMPGESGRVAHYPYWAVSGINFKVEPNSAWYDYGNKTFPLSCRADKEPMLNEAIDWCYQNFNIPKDQWEKDPFGNWQIQGTIQKAISERTTR